MSTPCASCGATVPAGEEFCDNCGTPVALDAPETRPASAPSPPAADAPTTERTAEAAGAAPELPPPPPQAPETSFRDPRADAATNAAVPAAPVLPTPAPPTRAGQAVAPARSGGRFIGLAALGVVLVLLLGTGGWLLLSSRDNAPEALQAPSPGGSEGGQEVEQEPPSGGETTQASEMTLAADPEPEPDYDSVQEDGLAMEVPAGWEVQTGPESEGSGTSWSLVLGIAEVSVTAAPDLEEWHSSGAVAGMYAVASRALTGYTNEQIITTGPNDLSGLCALGDARDFAKDAYSSRIQTWTDCGGDPDAKGYTVAIAPEAGGCAVALRIGAVGEGGLETAQHIMDTLEVDCDALPATADAITPSDVPAGDYSVPEGTTGGYVPPEHTTEGYTPPEGTTPQ